MSKNPIGVFDSGVGGLTVLKELVGLMPTENYVYFGDTARIPYGEKTKEQILAYVRGILEWFKAQDVKAVVMACNTSSAVAYNEVIKEYDFPIFSLIEPAADYISYTDAEKIGVLATSATVNSKVYSKTIQNKSSSKEVFEVACPGLVEAVEDNKTGTNEAKKLVIKYVTPLMEKKVDRIVLGCTHYPFLSSIINDVTNHPEMLINPAKYLAENVADELLALDLPTINESGSRQYFASSNPEKFVEAGSVFYDDVKEAQVLTIGEVTKVFK